jgi:aminopeptidase N
MGAHHEASEDRCQARGFAPPPGTPERHAPDRLLEVIHIALDLDVDLEQKTLRGTARHDVRVVPDQLETFTLDAVALTIESVTADGKPAPFVHDGQRIHVRPRTPWKRGEAHAVEIAYHGRPERGMWFVAPDEAYPDKPLQAWTQGQDEDARFWFPCADYPNQKATTEIRVRVPRGFEAISNGRLASRADAGDRTEFHWVQEIPHVTYLVSLVVGRFDVVEDRAGKTALRYLVPIGTAADARRTFGRTPEMVGVFERLFGHPYPWPKYDQVVVSDFLCGGMENTSATTLYDYALLDATVEGAVDRDDLISHELAHQWFGDLLTCRDWSHAWLNEGFATYAEVLWYENGESRDRGAWHLLQAAHQYFDEARDDYKRAIVSHAFEAPVDLFDRHLYEKAGCVLHHLRAELGDEPFFRGLRRYVAANARGLVETLDFRRALEAESGKNLEPFFDQWIFRAGHPEIEVTHTYEPSSRKLTLQVKQTQEGAAERPFRFRLPCRAWLADSRAAPVDRTFEVLEASHSFVWELPSDPGGLRVGGTALPLVRVTFARGDAFLARQLEADDDLLGRVDAAELLGKSGSEAAIAALARRLKAERTWMGQATIARSLGEARGSAAREALVGAGLGLSDPRPRSAAAAALGRFRDDPAAAAALEGLLERETSPIVRAAAYRSLGAARAPSSQALLTKGLWEPSWNEIVGRSCLDGLGLLRDRSLVPLFVNSLRVGEHELRRTSAVNALREAALAIEAKAPIREQFEHLLEDRSFRVASAAVGALRALGDAGAVPSLDRLVARRFADPRLRRAARAAAKGLLDAQAKLGAPASDRFERIENELVKLKERLAAVDGPKSQPPPAKAAGKPKRKPARAKKKRRR